MYSFRRLILAVWAAVVAVPMVLAVGWPAGYEGVMLQAFYWDSYTDTKWTNLESQADELSESFDLIWVPNSSYSGGSRNMGYTPVNWFTNHNSSFGSEAELRSMINTFKEKGTGVIADVVINHRSGRSNWTDFPAEYWDHKSWKIGLDGICCDDEVANQPGQATPTGAPDTGENFDGSRDLDHTNANVQENCKGYTRCLLEDFGYTGFRYDMVKGFSGKYVKMYNQSSHPTYSVGEYWDGSYDGVAAWIESTGRESAAFDFPAKYAINRAFSSGNMSELVWKANGTTDQPAGLIHYGYQQLAVTFLDNHDTYRNDNKLTGNVVAANAFILCSPGTPCVFLPHWKAYKAEIKALIAVRKAVGVSNTSAVRVLRSSSDCYMAEVTGSKGKLVVKIGSAQVSPDGYSNSDIKASGTDYCVWTKMGVNIDPTPDPVPGDVPANLYIMGNLKGNSWKTDAGLKLTKKDKVFTLNGVELLGEGGATDAYFSFVTVLGANWDAVNAGDRYGALTKDEAMTAGTPTGFTKYAAGESASSACAWKIASGKYDVKVDFETMNVTMTLVGQVTPDPTPDPTPGSDEVVIFFNNSNDKWATPYIYYWGGEAPQWPGVAMTQVGEDMWQYRAPKGTTGVIFNAGDGDATKTQDYTAGNGHVYVTGESKGYAGEHYAGDDGKIYVIGNLSGSHWQTAQPVAMTGTGHVYKAEGVELEAPDGAEKAYFTFIAMPGEDWDAVNAHNRFGAESDDADPATASAIKFYHKDINASAGKSWGMAPGKYDITADLAAMKLTVAKSQQNTIVDFTIDEGAEAEYFNLQGVRVASGRLAPGIYVKRQGAKVTKLVVF